MTYHVFSSDIGTKATLIKNWPTNDIPGLLDALSRWPLDRSLALESSDLEPFKSRAWGNCVLQYDPKFQKRVHVGTQPIYPDFPDAVVYCGNFLGHSFGFHLITADRNLIRELDEAIAKNLEAF